MQDMRRNHDQEWVVLSLRELWFDQWLQLSRLASLLLRVSLPAPFSLSPRSNSLIDNLFNDFLAEYVCALCAWGMTFSTPHTHRPRRRVAASCRETTADKAHGSLHYRA